MNPYNTYYRLDSPIFGNRKNGRIPKEVWVEEIVPDPKQFGGIFYTERYTTLPLSSLLNNRDIKAKFPNQTHDRATNTYRRDRAS